MCMTDPFPHPIILSFLAKTRYNIINVRKWSHFRRLSQRIVIPTNHPKINASAESIAQTLVA